MVRSTAIPLLILAGMALTPITVCAASITYDIVNYPTVQNGFTVTGTITTNGTTGTHLVTTDVISSWDFAISSGGTTVATFNSANPSNVIEPGTFDATQSALTVSLFTGTPLPPLEVIRFDNPTSFIIWQTTGTNEINYNSAVPGRFLWSTILPPGSPIATTTAIPEPSSAVLATIGAVVAFLAYGWSRHRRVQHRLESD